MGIAMIFGEKRIMNNTKTKKQFNLLFFVIGIILAVYGFYVLGMLGTGTWFNWIYIVGAAIFFAAALLWGKILNWKPWLKILLIALIAIALIVFGTLEYRIIKGSKTTAANGADYVIVLGAKVKESGISREFAVRIDSALAYWEENKSATIFLTGGQGDDEPMAESKAAMEYIKAKTGEKSKSQVYPNMLFEDKSTTTLENLKYALEVIKADGGNENSNIVIVSSQFHLYRTSLYAKALGYNNVSYIGSNGLVYLIPHYYIREFAAIVKELAKGNVRL